MRRNLQPALMAISVIATFLSLTTPYVQAEPGSGQMIATTDDSGRKIYVNESAPVTAGKRSQAASGRGSGSSLVYWSASQHRWKPVPSANVRAAQSAAAEVNQYLNTDSASHDSASHDSANQDSSESVSPPASSFTRGKAFTQKEIDAAIDQAAVRHNVDPSLVRAVIKVESNFNPNAVSRKGAMGLMQLMPQTARQLNVTNPFDPEQNVDAGVRHLKNLMESYGGDVKLSLAAYNAGAGAVARSAGVPHFAETRNYVNRITQLYYGGGVVVGSSFRAPVRIQRDARGVLYISNTD
jgi:soluble lytic murein transglycosylase-like protein